MYSPSPSYLYTYASRSDRPAAGAAVDASSEGRDPCGRPRGEGPVERGREESAGARAEGTERILDSRRQARDGRVQWMVDASFLGINAPKRINSFHVVFAALRSTHSTLQITHPLKETNLNLKTDSNPSTLKNAQTYATAARRNRPAASAALPTAHLDPGPAMNPHKRSLAARVRSAFVDLFGAGPGGR